MHALGRDLINAFHAYADDAQGAVANQLRFQIGHILVPNTHCTGLGMLWHGTTSRAYGAESCRQFGQASRDA